MRWVDFFCTGYLENHADLASQIEEKILQWIAMKAKKAIPGDVINIVVCGHGDPQRLGFYAGYNRIFPFELDRMLEKFKQGVTVNIISGSAHSVEEEVCEPRSAPTKGPEPLNEGCHGLGFSHIVSHSLRLLRPS